VKLVFRSAETVLAAFISSRPSSTAHPLPELAVVTRVWNAMDLQRTPMGPNAVRMRRRCRPGSVSATSGTPAR